MQSLCRGLFSLKASGPPIGDHIDHSFFLKIASVDQNTHDLIESIAMATQIKDRSR